MRALELKLPPVALVLLLGALMWLCARVVPAVGFAVPARALLAAAFGSGGVLVAVLGVIAFRRARTTVDPLHPQAASALVTTGIYRVTRNPMYLGMLLLLLGWALWLGNALALGLPMVFVPLMNRLQIVPEERILTAMFGAGFTDYQSRVRRWL